MSRANGWSDADRAKFLHYVSLPDRMPPLAGKVFEVRILPEYFRSVRVIYNHRSVDVEGGKGYLWVFRLNQAVDRAKAELVAREWRWTSAVWPSGSTNAHPRHIVHAGSPVAVCGYRAQRIDGERWYTRDYTDRVKCSKCAAWESKQPTESKEPA